MRDVLLVIHFIGLAMGLGTSFGFMFLGIQANKIQDKSKALDYTIHNFALSNMGHIALALLIISGLGLIHPHASLILNNSLLLIKLILVLALGATIGIISSWKKKIINGEHETYLPKMAKTGRILLLLNIAIISLAVLVFH